MRARLLVIAAFAFVLAFAACGKPAEAPPAPAPESSSPGAPLPEGHPPLDQTASTGGVIPPKATEGVGEKGLGWDIPAGWVSEPPTSALRRAQYKAAGPAGAAECVVFYFGPNEGGDPQSNAERWAQQFVKADGQPATGQLKTTQTEVNGLKVTLVEVAGAYLGGSGMGMPSGPPKPDYMLLGAIAEGPDSNWFFKFTGPRATVEAQRAAFDQMIRSLRKGA